jgi:hypothetical protein
MRDEGTMEGGTYEEDVWYTTFWLGVFFVIEDVRGTSYPRLFEPREGIV